MASSTAAERILAIDWLRGLSVLFMIQTHSLALLRPELRKSTLFDALQWIDGLVAPSFILAAGFSMALTQVRAATKAGDPAARRQRARRTLRRLGEVLAVGTLVNWMWFPLFRQPRFILRMDILQCIGFSLLVALPILFSLATHPRALQFAALFLACLAFGLSPLTESLGSPWAGFLNHKNDAVFPLLPWAGYVYLGAVIGAATAEQGRRGAARWLTALAALGIALWALTPWVASAYPPHEFWVTNPANHARRWTQVCLCALALLWLERVEGSWRASMPVRFLELFGTSSLAGYFFHEMLLFFRILGFSFEARWGGSASWSGYPWLVLLLVGATFALTWLTDRVYRALERWRPGAPKIRKATDRDAEEIARIINTAFEVERDFRRGDRTSASEIRKLMQRETFLVAEQGSRPIGAVEVRVDGASGYFGMLAVDPGARRAGLGRALVEASEDHCRRAGCRVMTMSTGEDRTELIPYYQKMGYRVTATELSSSAAFTRAIRVVQMEKPLLPEAK